MENSAFLNLEVVEGAFEVNGQNMTLAINLLVNQYEISISMRECVSKNS